MEDLTVCPHCGSQMKKWRVPEFSTWSAEFFWVCFNDECPYFVRGWAQMETTVANRVSYRFRYDPDTGYRGPLPVWSADALRSGIIED